MRMRSVGKRLRVLVVDDHPISAQGLRYALDQDARVEVVGVAMRADEGAKVAAERHPDVVLLDFHLPEESGGDAARRIAAAAPDAVIVFLSGDDSMDAMAEAVAAGAAGYVIKTADPGVIADAAVRAGRGELLVPQETFAALIAHERRQTRDRAEVKRIADSLTARELDVLRLMAEGLDNRAIAERLGVELNTVRTYGQRVLEKLGAHSKLQAVVRASRLGLLSG